MTLQIGFVPFVISSLCCSVTLLSTDPSQDLLSAPHMPTGWMIHEVEIPFISSAHCCSNTAYIVLILLHPRH